MANTKISQWTEQTLSNMAAAGTSDLLGGINTTSGSQNRKFSLATIANFILSKFKPSALSGIGDGSTTGAISSLNSKTNNRFYCRAVDNSESYKNVFISFSQTSGVFFVYAMNRRSDKTPLMACVQKYGGNASFQGVGTTGFSVTASNNGIDMVFPMDYYTVSVFGMVDFTLSSH